VVNVSSDAAVESYPGWGGYGSAKAALDRLTAVLAIECPQLRIYSFDAGLASGRYRATDLPAGLAR
jgi:NAD(P)-dependent dehydrogenase (short-subunit alcohol dehydrogenase family)